MHEDTLDLQREIVDVLQDNGFDVEGAQIEEFKEGDGQFGRIQVEIPYDHGDDGDDMNPFRVK